MESTTETIVDFVDSFDSSRLTGPTVHEIKLRLVDSLGCALGGVNNPPAEICRGLAGEVSARRGATVLGLNAKSSMEMAALANTVMLRYLDYNDTYFSPRGGGGHPSDLIPTCLAVGEATGASGRDVLGAITVGYEVFGRVAGTARIRERGWDQGLFVVVAAAMAAGKLLGLNRSQLAHAVSLAVIPNIPTRRTRAGELSMWKGAATAAAARNGVFAALLADRGMTGPPSPFEGEHGIWQQVTGPFSLEIPQQATGGFVVENTHIKPRPAEYNSQGPLDLVEQFRAEIDVADIERVDVDTYWLCWSEIGSEPEKWRPANRETADHSLPYLLALGLLDGDIEMRSFTTAKLADPRVRDLMDRISVTEVADFTAAFPREIKSRIRLTLRDGRTHERASDYPRGHARAPLSDREIDGKFDSILSGWPEHNAAIARAVRAEAWSVDSAASIGPMMAPLAELDPTVVEPA